MRAAVVALAAGFLVLPATDAAAQECAAPQIRNFISEPNPLRAGQAEWVGVAVEGAARVTVEWPDGTRSTADVHDDLARFDQVFPRVGVRRALATATAACGATSRAAMVLDVRARCARARDDSVNAEDCDRERGSLAIAQRGLATTGTWMTAPCRDNPTFPGFLPPPEPVARAAVCALTAPPWPVAGRLPVRNASVVVLRLGVPARSVRVALGNSRRRTTRFSRAGARGAGRRVFRIRVARITRSSRLWVRVRTYGGREEFVAGVRRATQSS